jgi:hypothetical protein
MRHVARLRIVGGAHFPRFPAAGDSDMPSRLGQLAK